MVHPELDQRWKSAAFVLVGIPFGVAAGIGFAAHQAREVARYSLELVHEYGEASRGMRLLQARRDLATLAALRRDRIDDAAASLEWQIERHISQYSGTTDATDEEAKLLSDLRAYAKAIRTNPRLRPVHRSLRILRACSPRRGSCRSSSLEG